MSAASSDAYGPVGLRLRLSRPTRLEDGKHMVVAWVDEVELGRTTVQGTTLRAEFLRGGWSVIGVVTKRSEFCHYGCGVREEGVKTKT